MIERAENGIGFRFHSRSPGLLTFVLLLVYFGLVGCEAVYPEGRIQCAEHSECPSDWVCREDGYCWKSASDDYPSTAEPSADSGASDFSDPAGAGGSTGSGDGAAGGRDDAGAGDSDTDPVSLEGAWGDAGAGASDADPVSLEGAWGDAGPGGSDAGQGELDAGPVGWDVGPAVADADADGEAGSDCESTCTDPCYSCNVPGQLGICAPIASGSDPDDDCGSCNVCDGDGGTGGLGGIGGSVGGGGSGGGGGADGSSNTDSGQEVAPEFVGTWSYTAHPSLGQGILIVTKDDISETGNWTASGPFDAQYNIIQFDEEQNHVLAETLSYSGSPPHVFGDIIYISYIIGDEQIVFYLSTTDYPTATGGFEGIDFFTFTRQE